MSLVNEKIHKQDTRKKYCRFKKNGIQYIDYKDGVFLLKFVNEQGKLLPRRLTGTSLKFQRASPGNFALRSRFVKIRRPD